MDYSSFFPHQYPNLTAANLQAAANSTFQLNQNPPTNVGQQQQQQQPSNTVSQLQQNMFYLDSFNADCPPSNEVDHGSHSNESDQFLDDLDDLSRNPNIPQTGRNLQSNNVQQLSAATDFDVTDLSQEFLDTSTGVNSNKRKAQNRAAQRAFRERKERHVKELEAKVTALEEVTNKMADENGRLKSRLVELEAENNSLKGANITVTFPQYKELLGDSSIPPSDRGSLESHEPQQQTDTPMEDVEDLNTSSGVIKPVSPVALSDANGKADSSIHVPTTPFSTRAQNLMVQYNNFAQHNHSIFSPLSPDDGHNYLECPQVWERMVTHPRFDEIDDIDALCARLNTKVKICVERGGACVESRELETALDQAIEESVAAMS